MELNVVKYITTNIIVVVEPGPSLQALQVDGQVEDENVLSKSLSWEKQTVISSCFLSQPFFFSSFFPPENPPLFSSQRVKGKNKGKLKKTVSSMTS